MKVGLDARYLSHGLIGGVRTYVYHLAREVPPLAAADEFYHYIDEKAPFELQDLPPNVTVRTLPWTSAWSSVVNDIGLARRMEHDGIDVAHFPANYGPAGAYASVVTVHDALNLFRMSEHWRSFGKTPRQVALMAYLGWKTRRALRTADCVVTISEHARGELARKGNCALSRITAIHEAAGDEFRVIADPAVMQDARRRWIRRPLTVLADGIKNPAVLVEAFHALPGDVRARVELLFFSREQLPRPAVAAALADPGIRFVARPGTGDLVALMNLATVFVFPSWYEGFGLPLVEAMSCGAPVIASSRGSIPEVLGGAGLLFDVERPAELAHHLRAVLESESLRQDLRTRSLDRSRNFSWRTTASRTLDVYRRAASGRTPGART